ncbi:MAG TPA: alpha/beta hydrolase [Chloroflexaceae bacterium]|nr:alpha/beta hydrolase [Chloroflexaceae bacterium]
MRLAPLALALLLLLALGACAPAPPPEAAGPALALEPCRLSAPGVAQTFSAECGALAVPEDPASPGGRSIELNIAVVPAISRAPAPDPLFLLAGGPGQAATEAFIPVLPALRQANQARDLVLVDQRGTGGSNPLRCPIDDEDLELAAAEPEDPAFQSWLAACLAGLDADPRLYTTALAAGDLDAVRAALGYERVNLLGVSYGTRAALTYLRLFPERVRALVLDGVVPPDMAIGAAMAGDGQRALDMAFAACEADAACAEAFPEARADFAALLAALDAEPLTVALDDPFTGEPAEVRLTRELAASTVFNLSYSPEATALLPLLIHSAQREGDPRPLAAQSLIVGREAAEMIALGMRNAVLCAEDVPFYPATPGAGPGYLGDLMARVFSASCAAWPAAEADPASRAPAQSPVPALLLSGERDPVTPPAYGEAVAAGLPNSLHIVAPGQGHNVFYRGCVPGLVADFLAAGAPDGLDAACVERLGAPPFFTSFTGPTP